MRSSAALTVLLAPLLVLAQGPTVQVNFYSDLNCQDFIGSEYGTDAGIGPTGGPAGSYSALYVHTPTCYDAPACSYFCEDSSCDEKTGGSTLGPGECWSYTEGVWAEAYCNGC